MILYLFACGPTAVAVGDDTASADTDTDTDTDTDADTDADSDTDVEVIDDTALDTDVPDEAAPDVVVDCTGAGDYTTIADAIAAMPSGTRIGLAPCTYEEDVNFRGKSLDIFGIGGRSVTTLQGGGRGPVVTAVRGESVGTRLAHVTITGGGGEYGAGIYLERALLTVEDAVITGAERTGAVIYTSGAGLTLRDVDIEGNDYQRGGYVFYTDNGWLVAQDMYMTCDDAQYGLVEHEATLVLDSEITCADADVAVYVSGGELHMRRSDVVGGTYGIYGEDNDDTRNERMWLFNTSVVADDTAVIATFMHVKARNDTFWGGRVGIDFDRAHADSYMYSSAAYGSRCAVSGDGATYAAAWNAIGDETACSFPMTDTVTGDFGFVDAPEDLRLAAGSPLIDAGDPDEDENDDDDTRNDIGRYGGPEADGPR